MKRFVSSHHLDESSQLTGIGLQKDETIQLWIAPQVEEAIIRETRAYVDDNLETGGLLVGRWLTSNSVLLVAATGAGPDADHQRLTFALDTDYANQQLDYLRQQYPQADYIGEWHKHPAQLPIPSDGDLQMAFELLADPSYPDRLINPITVCRQSRIEVNYFFIQPGFSNFVQLRPQLLSRQEYRQILAANPDMTAGKTTGSGVTRPGPGILPGRLILLLALAALTVAGTLLLALLVISGGSANHVNSTIATTKVISPTLAVVTLQPVPPTPPSPEGDDQSDLTAEPATTAVASVRATPTPAKASPANSNPANYELTVVNNTHITIRITPSNNKAGLGVLQLAIRPLGSSSGSNLAPIICLLDSYLDLYNCIVPSKFLTYQKSYSIQILDVSNEVLAKVDSWNYDPADNQNTIILNGKK